jgi:hypothetical protein
VGTDSCRLLIHKSASKLREAAKRLGDAYTSGDDELIQEAEIWSSFDSDVHWFARDWKYWDQEKDDGALECLGWERLIVESGAKSYRVTIRVAKKA